MNYEYIILFALAFIVAFSSTPAVRKLAFKIRAVDIPKDTRRMHNKPIARLGGMAIFLGFVVSLMFGVVSTFLGASGILPDRELLGLLIGALIIVGIGIVDDIKQLGARFKLVFQIIAALCVVFISNTRITNLTNPFASEGVSQLNDITSYVITVLWIIGITNAINLIDGLDGLAAGVSSISYLSLFFISILNGESSDATIIAILAGATLGFLPYNFNPAKIFMGDTGSTFLGFTLAVVSIQGMIKTYAAFSIAIPLLVLGLPLFDTISTIIRRILKRKPIMQPDREHLHHRLIDMGLSQKQSVGVMYTASAVLGLCAVVLTDRGVIGAIVLIASVSIFIIAGAKYMSEMEDIEVEEKEESKRSIGNLSIKKVKDAER
ncbi:MraY family glycosyltransferase [Acetivibrio saccincola]|uniref:Undecaprenyl-phosphate alpha-N-acetylglucosaminyl 1-phosphate transferase n=1 Tax=Acetivibrio saccincola TaxID=1677857 RepID=A0A2S8R809_9FIRM|nr:MraY family glycosyltransferase [Acetivibrio saccincola]PQQ65914.1 undecaprenyl-phosphate alpha-N-acetylglucosaminyl 1-phosphate transferase [Acetivibrio saccincola]